MKKFSRCMLILILTAIISGVTGMFYFNKTTIPMYTSTAKLYVVPGAENEASVRAKDGGLNNDFMILFKSSVVISAAQTKVGTSEDIAQYLTISSPANSNVIEITCTNPDQNTAKTYVDAVASVAIKTNSIIPVESIQILSQGTSDGVAYRPNIYRNAAKVTGVSIGAVFFLEVVILLFIGAFKKKEDDYDDELEYEKKYGKYAALNVESNGGSPARIEDNSYSAQDLQIPVVKQDDDTDILADIDSLESDEPQEIQEETLETEDAAEEIKNNVIQENVETETEQSGQEPVRIIAEEEEKQEGKAAMEESLWRLAQEAAVNEVAATKEQKSEMEAEQVLKMQKSKSTSRVLGRIHK